MDTEGSSQGGAAGADLLSSDIHQSPSSPPSSTSLLISAASKPSLEQLLPGPMSCPTAMTPDQPSSLTQTFTPALPPGRGILLKIKSAYATLLPKTTEQQPFRLQWHKGSSWSGSGPCLPVYSELLPPPHHTELLALPLRHQHPHCIAHPCCPLGLEGLPPTPVSLDNSSSILQGSAVAPPPPGGLP